MEFHSGWPAGVQVEGRGGSSLTVPTSADVGGGSLPSLLSALNKGQVGAYLGPSHCRSSWRSTEVSRLCNKRKGLIPALWGLKKPGPAEASLCMQVVPEIPLPSSPAQVPFSGLKERNLCPKESQPVGLRAWDSHPGWLVPRSPLLGMFLPSAQLTLRNLTSRGHLLQEAFPHSSR